MGTMPVPGAPITKNLIDTTATPTIEIQVPIAKNQAAGTLLQTTQIPLPTAPVLMYAGSCSNSSIDSDILVRLFNRRTFLITGTAQAGDATHITLAATANPTNDHYNGFVITITGGTGAGQTKTIADYVGATCVAEVSAWATNPDNTSTYSIALIRDCLVSSLTFAKASLSAPIILANDSAIVTGLFTGGCDVYAKFYNAAAIANADASRCTAVFQLVPIA